MDPLSPSLHVGARVTIGGLKGELASALNGSVGILSRYDLDSERWEVDTEKAGFKKIRSINLLPCQLSDDQAHHCLPTLLHPRQVRRRAKACRFGNVCWRPNCHFSHGDEADRCQRWARFWSSDNSVPSGPKDDRAPVLATVATLQEDLASHAAQVDVGVQKIADLQHQLIDVSSRLDALQLVTPEMPSSEREALFAKFSQKGVTHWKNRSLVSYTIILQCQNESGKFFSKGLMHV